MPKFLLIVRNDTSQPRNLSPAEMQKVVERYRNWAIAQAGKVIMAESNKLANDGRVLVARQGSVSVKDGPYAETKDVIGGYFMAEAADYEAAVAIARGCPHLEGNGMIEVRRLEG